MTDDLDTIQRRIKKEKDSIIDKLKEVPVVTIACRKAGVSRSTYYRWLDEDPDFAKELESAKRSGILLINDVAESHLINKIKDGEMQGITFWLTHNHNRFSPYKVISETISEPKPGLLQETLEALERIYEAP